MNKRQYERARRLGRCTQCNKVSDQPDKSMCSLCTPEFAKVAKKYHESLRRDAFNAYGGPQCACCGTLVDEFLTMDHIEGGGAAHRAELRGNKNQSGGGGIKLYLWMKRMGYPPGFQVLCMNCNFTKGKYGVCPHQRDVQDPH